MAGAALVIASAALLLATELPNSLSAGGGSVALAELAARSPGVRIGGVALKAKTRRAALPPATVPAAGSPSTPVASVLGTSVVPEGPLPTSGPLGPGGFPSDFFAPGATADIAPQTVATTPATGFAPPPIPPIGGLPGLVPGVGFVPGAGTTPGPESPGGGDTQLPPPPPPPVGGAIPEPSTWLLLISGFAMIGGAMRRNRRVRFA